MVSKQILRPILGDDAVTRGLADEVARELIEWLVHQAEKMALLLPSTELLQRKVHEMCRHARAISRFITLWTNPRDRGAALQLAAVQRFAWPFPTCDIDAYDLLLDILSYEAPALDAISSSLNNAA